MYCVVLDSNYFTIIEKKQSLSIHFFHFFSLVNIHHKPLLNFIYFIIITLVTVT